MHDQDQFVGDKLVPVIDNFIVKAVKLCYIKECTNGVI